MTSSENLASFAVYEPLMFLSTAAYADSRLTEALARDAETLTKALQKTISGDTNNYGSETVVVTSSDAVLSFCKADQQMPSASGASGSDPEMAATVSRRRVAATSTGGATKKIAKRKPRATKKCQPTFILADPANFRQKVQEVTGVRFETFQHQLSQNQVIVKPEPKRLTGTGLPQPTTLDTSFFVDYNLNSQQQQEGVSVFGGQREGALTGDGDAAGQVAYGESLIGRSGGAGYGYESYHSFPTLESGKVMCDY